MNVNYELGQRKSQKNLFTSIVNWSVSNKAKIAISIFGIGLTAFGNILLGVGAGIIGLITLYCYNIYFEVNKLDFSKDLNNLKF